MVFITKSGKEIQVPNDYTYMSLEKFAQEIYQQGRADKYQEITSEYMLMTEELIKHNIDDAIDDFAKTLIEEVEEYEDSMGGVGVHYTVFTDMIKGVWQQLKEQKND